MEHSGPDRPSSNFRSRLNSRLLEARTLVINEALTADVAGRITEQLAVLDAESAEPIRVMMTTVPGGDVEAGLSTYDVLRSLTAEVTVLGSGRITGAGVLAFAGAPSDRRFALPHARFRFAEPTDVLDRGQSADLEEKAQAAADRRERMVSILSDATGHSEGQIQADLSCQRVFEPDEAAEYGLLHRVVQSGEDVQ